MLHYRAIQLAAKTQLTDSRHYFPILQGHIIPGLVTSHYLIIAPAILILHLVILPFIITLQEALTLPTDMLHSHPTPQAQKIQR